MIVDLSEVFACEHDWEDEFAHVKCTKCGLRRRERPLPVLGPAKVAVFICKADVEAMKVEALMQEALKPCEKPCEPLPSDSAS